VKITFIYPDLESQVENWTGYFYHGVAMLSAALKQDGHLTSLIHIVRPMDKDEFISRIRSDDPGLIGFSSSSHMFPIVRELLSWLAEAGIEAPTICGGIHPTLAPEKAIAPERIDMICRGEGEGALAELCRRMEKEEDISDIKNLWIKTDGGIIKNPLGPVVEDLDTLPAPDRSIFDYENLISERNGTGTFMASRGCSFECTYCCNHTLKRLYDRNGNQIRFRSVDHVIDEIKQVVEKYPFIKRLVFDDDILFLYRKWARAFTEKYSREINLPFECHGRADITDQEVVDLLETAGCAELKLGLESGNEEIRRQILNRPMTNQQIKNAFGLAKKAGLATKSYNIVGSPNDTPVTILDTIKLNAEIGPDKLYYTICQPYDGTRLAEICEQQNLVTSGDLGPDFFSSSVLQLKTVSSAQVTMFRDYFLILVRYYQLLLEFPPTIANGLIRFSDRVFSNELVARALNGIKRPLRRGYQRLRALRSQRGRIPPNASTVYSARNLRNPTHTRIQVHENPQVMGKHGARRTSE
jgi:radical SAM superfamily enzyme YgiQ (UPF0313 family)